MRVYARILSGPQEADLLTRAAARACLNPLSTLPQHRFWCLPVVRLKGTDKLPIFTLKEGITPRGFRQITLEVEPWLSIQLRS